MSSTAENWRSWVDFDQSRKAHPERPAINVGGRKYSYREFGQIVDGIERLISDVDNPDNNPIAAVWADRSVLSFAAILACSKRGYAYVPIHPDFPEERNRSFFELSAASIFVSYEHATHQTAAYQDFLKQGGVSQIVCAESVTGAASGPALHDCPHAYVLFTSGSTGLPKGVLFRHSNLNSYLNSVFELLDYNCEDRISQNHEFTFDLSVHDMFVCWRAGAELVVPSAAELERPAQYMKNHDVTCWFCVPSLAQKIRLQGDLQEGSLSQLRISLFCGEALPVDLAIDWKKATGKRVENFYGPTEAQSVSHFPIPDSRSDFEDGVEVVPIGKPFSGMDMFVVDENNKRCGVGERGELLLTGSQVADGYLNNPEKTNAAFVLLPEFDGVHYRSGDKCFEDKNGDYHFVERIDHQIKLHGYRIELGEIEHKIRNLASGCSTVVLPHPFGSPTPEMIYGVVEGWDGDLNDLLDDVKEQLPDYMVPKRIFSTAMLPKNMSGKIDRKVVSQIFSAAFSDESSTEGPKTKFQRKIFKTLQSVSPGVEFQRVSNAENLFDAGVDSLSFLKFTAALEKRFGVELTEEIVQNLATEPFKRICRYVQRNRQGGAFRNKNKRQVLLERPDLHPASIRVLNFLHKFPRFLRKQRPGPLILFFGSSGTYNGIDATYLNSYLSDEGDNATVLNLGMNALSIEGTIELAEFVIQEAVDQGREIEHCILECDIVDLSPHPSAGALEFVSRYINGEIPLPKANRNSRWDASIFGDRRIAKKANESEVQPEWIRTREETIQEIYKGNVEFRDEKIEALVNLCNFLKNNSRKFSFHIHPTKMPGLAKYRAKSSDNPLNKLVRYVEEQVGVRMIRDTDFDLSADKFVNLNHIGFDGKTAFTTQLMEKLDQSR